MKKVSIFVVMACAFSLLLGSGALAAREDMGGAKAGQSQSSSKIISESTLKVTKMTGAKVENRQGEQLGTVEDFVVSPEGRIQYMVLSHGGMLGIGDRFFAIPWKAVRPGLRGDDVALIVDISRDKLAKAPSFERNNWPNFADPQVDVVYYGYYGLQPEKGDVRAYPENTPQGFRGSQQQGGGADMGNMGNK